MVIIKFRDVLARRLFMQGKLVHPDIKTDSQ
jgi:hypothetical protein